MSSTDSVSIHVVSTSGDARVTLTVSSEITVAEFKEELSAQNEVPVEEQRLIYRGRILKDQDTLQSYGVTPDCVFHLARKPRQTAQSPTGTPSATTTVTSPPPVPPSTPQSNPFSSLLGGQSPEGINGLQEAVLQSVVENPDLMQSFMRNTPAVQQLMDQNPELAQVMNNPELIRESLRLVSNPNLMQEHLRNMDRAMSNLESIPGGFNALRQIYENVQEPLMNATQARSDSDNPFAALFNQTSTTTTGSTNTPAPPPATGTVNTQPLPNPWAPPPSSTPAATPASGTGQIPGLGLSSGMNSEQLQQMMQNPAFQQMVQSVLSDPAAVNRLAASIPGMRNMLDSNPAAREMLSNPDTMRTMMTPENLQAMSQLQQSIQTLQRGGLGPLLNIPEGDALSSLLGSIPAAPPVTDPETTYATQLQQLQEMGFYDRAANVRALQATGGNVNAAVERLLSQL